MQSLGFENYAEVLKVYLGKYRETIKVDKTVGGYKEDEGVEPSNGLFQTSQEPSQHLQTTQYPPNYYTGQTYSQHTTEF
ncbi:transcriptional activator hap3 [Basidiobolus ranarum]|uniref:Transcriptional activator hap3 n=1 Tax=Basidiobolus ranarum TaxID=34480 RepID=A0ABR2WVB7_9FUNG